MNLQLALSGLAIISVAVFSGCHNGLSEENKKDSTVFAEFAAKKDSAAVVENIDTLYFNELKNKPALPPDDNKIHVWHAKHLMNWPTQSYKAYIFNQMPFRLLSPVSVIAGKKYPLIISLHGYGEKGDFYDNETQLVTGGLDHLNAVKQGRYDGYVLYPQSIGAWYDDYYTKLISLINVLSEKYPIDIFRVNIHGLSSGGRGVVEILRKYPSYFSAAVAMSAVGGWEQYDRFVTVPLWITQGENDRNPSKNWIDMVVSDIKAQGGDVKYSIFKYSGHNIWDKTYAEEDFFPFQSRSYKSNPLVYFSKNKLHSNTDSVKLGLSPGFDEYMWRKDGVILKGQKAPDLIVNEAGTYDARVKRNEIWSKWSPSPAIISGP